MRLLYRAYPFGGPLFLDVYSKLYGSIEISYNIVKYPRINAIKDILYV